MGKAINSFIDSVKNQYTTKDTIVLRYVDLLHPKGERYKYVNKKNKKNPQIRVPTKIRTVTYFYPNANPSLSKTTNGWEIVEEILIPRGAEIPKPQIVEHVNRVVGHFNVVGVTGE
jgi:hypothetical protein